MTFPADSAAGAGLAVCHGCYRATPVEAGQCPRCGSALHLRTPQSLQRTLALLFTATLLYIPANALPIMTTDQLGSSLDSTILGGVILLVQYGSYPVATVIFVASVMVPIGKLVALYWLCFTVHRGHPTSMRQRTVLYRVTELIGRWSMVDVFVVTILVGLIQLGGLLVIRPGVASLAFAGVVIVTMLAAETFDPRLIWDRASEEARSDDG